MKKNSKTIYWILGVFTTILVIALFIGGVDQASQKVSPQTLADEDVRPFSHSDETLARQKTKTHPTHKHPKKALKNTVNLDRVKGAHTFHNNENKKKDSKKDNENKKEAKKAENEEDEEGKEKEEDNKDQEEIADNNHLEDSEEVANEPEGFNKSFDPLAATPTPQPEKQEPKEDTTLKEWSQRLLAQPNFGETTKFIKHFQTGQINADVFYTIVEQMLKDSRPEMQGLGIMAASANPSFDSFELLSDYTVSKPHNSPLRNKASSELEQDYTQIENIRIVSAILANSSSPQAVVFAARYLDQMAQKYLQNTRTPSEDDGELTEQEAQTSRLIPQFEDLVIVLERLVQESNDPTATEAAQKTLNNLKKLLNA